MGSNAYEVHVSFPVSGLQLARTVGQHHPLVLKEGTLFNASFPFPGVNCYITRPQTISPPGIAETKIAKTKI